MVDAGRAHADSRLNANAPNPIRPRETDIIKAKNNSGALRRTGEILRISGKAIETVTDENKWLLGVVPTADGYFGILKEPAAISGIASLQVSGVCIALVDITDIDHTRADVVAGEYVLASSTSGPLEILYQPGTTGEHECVVRFAGGGGAAEIIQFQPTDVCEGIGLTCDCVTATVLTASCGSSVQPGDVVQVWDQSRGWFQMPEELLFASVGWAHKVKVTEAEQYDLPFDVGPCRYVVISMDCIEQEPA